MSGSGRKQEWGRVVTNRIGAGVYIAVQPPFGCGKAEDGGLVKDETGAIIVQELFQRRARGESLGRGQLLLLTVVRESGAELAAAFLRESPCAAAS